MVENLPDMVKNNQRGQEKSKTTTFIMQLTEYFEKW